MYDSIILKYDNWFLSRFLQEKGSEEICNNITGLLSK